MSDIFTIDDSCDGIDIDSLLADALTLLNSAKTGVTMVTSSKTFVGGDSRRAMRNAHEMFGIAYYSKTTVTGLSSDDQASMSTVSTNIGALTTLLSGEAATRPRTGGTVQLGPTNAYFACSDTNYVRTSNAQDVDPSQPDGTTTKEAYALPYVYVIKDDKFNNADGVRRRVIRWGETFQDRICNVGAQGLTQTQTDFTANEPMIQIIFCPPVWNNANYLPTISGATAPGSSANIDQFKFRGGVLVHEGFHLFGNAFNDARFYLDGDPTLRDPYGPENIFVLATSPGRIEGQYSSEIDTKFLPDAYRIFSQMSQFPGTKWTYAKTTTT